MIYTDIKIIKAKTLEPYKIELEFNDGKIKVVDLEGILYGNVYGPLRNPDLFNELRVNTEISTIEWPNGADFHPETLEPEFGYYHEAYFFPNNWEQVAKLSRRVSLLKM